MTREQLLRDLDQMCEDAQGMCGCIEPEFAEEQRQRYQQAGRIIEKILRNTPPPQIRDIAKRLKNRSLREGKIRRS